MRHVNPGVSWDRRITPFPIRISPARHFYADVSQLPVKQADTLRHVKDLVDSYG
jgi:hypothetical protein